MKVNVTVDLSEFYAESDEASFSQQIKEHIAWKVKHELFDDFKKKMSEDFTSLIKSHFEEQKEFIVKKVFDELVIDAKIKKPYSGEEKISIKDWMCQELERMSLSDNKLKEMLTSLTKKQADSISTELKTRYDLLFASQIVTKLNEQGMLNENVAKLLLTQ